jgi:hypothetical protein
VDHPVTNRRGDSRLSGLSLPVAHATLRPGTAVHIIDLSEAGAQIQTDRPLRPGSRVCFRLDTAGGTIGLAAQVLRCSVWTIHPYGGISYRAALRFDARCPSFWEELDLDPRLDRHGSPRPIGE